MPDLKRLRLYLKVQEEEYLYAIWHALIVLSTEHIITDARELLDSAIAECERAMGANA